MFTKENVNTDNIYVAYPKIMDSKYWWIVEMIIGLLGIIGMCLLSFC